MSKYHKMDANKYPNIFGCHIMYQMNIRIKGPGILKGCVNEANICALFAHFLSEMCIKLTQAPPNSGSGYGMTKNYQTFMCMA